MMRTKAKYGMSDFHLPKTCENPGWVSHNLKGKRLQEGSDE